MRQRHLLGLAVVAGAMLLVPGLVSAHSGAGACADCHTMHNSQDGLQVNTAGPQDNLLKFSCIGCHAYTTNLPATGRADGSTGPAAPQVGPQVASSGAVLSGGYLSTGGGAEDGRTHNVADLFAVNTGADSLITSGNSPGGGFAIDDGSGAPLLRCESCHDLDIGHAPADSARAGNATSSYRMLHRGAQYVAGTGDLNFEAGGGQNQYNAASMNSFCATCHGTFHGLANTDSVGDGSGAWIRHPTDVTTNAYGANYDGSNKIVPVGDAGNTNQVMCLSCHRPHGNANGDMLRFSYNGTDNIAGDLTASLGCETCHGVK